MTHTATDIAYMIARSSLGLVLVAVTADGVAAVLLGDDDEALVRDLGDRFAGRTLVPEGASVHPLAARVLAHLEAPLTPVDIPLDVSGTAFQRGVWNVLRTIPAGTTATYAEVATRLGQPRAVRAVGRACAENAHAVLIPCHRVVRSDGALSGYRWGAERKRRLLVAERL